MNRYITPPLSDEERAAFVAAARSYLGVPWRHQGRSRKGIDCGGLIVCALADIGVMGCDITGYGRVAYRGRLEQCLRENLGDPIPKASMQPGDVAVVSYGDAPNHVGIVGDYLHGGLSFIHSYAPNRKVIEHHLDDKLRGQIVEVYRP